MISPVRHRGLALVSVLVMFVVAVAAGLYLTRNGADAGPAEDGSDGPFRIVELANRDLDGSPALALTFSQPLDARRGYDPEIQVFEMPPEAGATNDRQAPQDEDSEDGEGSPDPDGKATLAASTAPADVATDGGTLVKGAWTVGDNPRLLFFPHIKPRTRYVVRIAAGLPARSGHTLAAESRYSIRTAAVSPAYYFASQGAVLPARQNGGLPVVTVNVPEVDIQFLRVKPDQLPRFLDRIIRPARQARGADRSEDDEVEGDEYDDANRRLKLRGAIGNWELDSLHGLTDSVYAGRFLTEQKSNRRSVTFIPVEDIKALQEPGVYIAVMSQPNRFRYDYQVSWFYVSDLGLHLRLFDKGADAYVSSLTDGKGLKGVEISWIDEAGKLLTRSETDADGRASFAERPASARVVMARKGQQMSLIATREPALDLSEFDIAGLPGRALRLFAWSGRNLYRPGERFDLSVLARDADGRPVPPQPVQAILKRPDGKAQFTATWQADAGHAGYYRRPIELPADAPTGAWVLELRADPADKLPTNTYRFQVEEFLPERMKLALTPAHPSLDKDHPFHLEVQGSYLYGAPASGNRLLGVVQYERNKNPLGQALPGFEFGDVNEDSARSRAELNEASLDEAGKAAFDIDLEPASSRQSPFTVRGTLSLLESGGRPVVRSVERVYWPAPVLVGVRPLFQGDYARENTPARFEVVRADRDGKLRGASLPVRLFRENRDYYWRFDDQRGWHSGFTETDELVATRSVAITATQRGQLEVPVKYGRYRLEISDPETGKTLKYRFYAGWSAKGDEEQGLRPDRVALKLDKPAYKDGDSARLSITPPHGGQALVSVEGDKTLWVKRLAMPAEGTTVDIPLDPAWRRHDLHVTVLVLRPGSEGDRITPARAVGLIHLPLERGDRKLAVSLEAPKKMLPETALKVKVRVPAAKGQKTVLTLSAVDVGILNITRFPSPDPHAHFFGKLRYGADLYDVYGRLIEKMAGRKGKLKWGGDAAPKPTQSLPKKVRLVDLFSGPVSLDEQGEAEISLPVPDFNGSLRLMAVVASPDRFGSAEAEVVVAAPLVAELSTPRFLTVGDSATIALDLHNLSGAEQKLKVEISSPDGLRIQNASQTLTLADQHRQTLRFPVEAGSAFGLAAVKVQVGGSLALNREFALQVQAPTPQQQYSRRFTLAPDETLVIKDAELGGFLRNSVEAHLSVSNQPPIDVRSAIQGLLVYPYGCAEQTTSTAYPHVFVDEDSARRFGLKPFSREQRAAMLEKSIARLGAMQAPNGGFSLWGNVSEYEYWLSAYVTHFLLDAREQGFSVPPAVQQKATDFLLRALQEGVAGLPSAKATYNENSIWADRRYAGSGRFGVLAYGAYVLARESKAPLATLRQLHELRAQAHSGLALVQLGIALKLMGDEARARVAIAEGIAKPRDNGYWWGDYGSPLRDAALSYALLQRHRIQAEGSAALVTLAAAELDRNRWTSTQEKFALFLIGRELGNPEKGAAWRAELSTGGDKAQPLSGPGSQVSSLAADRLATGAKLRNSHSDKLFVELGVSGHPARMPAERSDVIALERKLFDSQGKPLGERPLRVGESVLLRVLVKPKVHIANALVVDRIPAGLEIENLNLVQGEAMGSVTIDGIDPAAAMADRRIQHVEFRDDRFAAALRLDGPIQLFYRARVVTPGRFVVPPVFAEDMYRPDTYGLADGGRSLTVVDGKEKDKSSP